MSNIDWTIHLVGNGVVCQKCGKVENPFPKNICNAHTHGMNRYGHPEFQLILHLHPTTTCAILNNLGKRVQAGEQFKAGEYVSNIIMDYKVRLDEFQEDNRKVLRVILPDPQNRFPEDESCEYPYNIQTFTLEALQLIRLKQDSKQLKIRIYQMELNEGTAGLKYQDLAEILKHSEGLVPEEKYRVVFAGKIQTRNLEDIFSLFNDCDNPDFFGHSLSTSDVIEVISEDGNSHFYFCSSAGFEEIDFDPDLVPGGIEDE